MKYNVMARVMGKIMASGIKPGIPEKALRRDIQKEYKRIFLGASDIGGSNRLLGAYCMAAFFIAMNRLDGRSLEENGEILASAVKNSRVYRAAMGGADSYFSEKNMESRRKWSKETHDAAHQAKYPNDWVVDVVEKGEDFQFGFDYTQCGVCKLCRDEGHPEYAKYLCALDFLTVDMMGIGLRRQGTLAEGSSKCDFRFCKK